MMDEAKNGLVLCCDATNVLSTDFVEKALPWFGNTSIAAVYGRITQAAARTAAERWRGRHLYRLSQSAAVRHHARLSTYGALVRARAVRQVGGYNPRLRHTEDGDLGERLLAAQWDVVYDPRLEAVSISSNSLGQVLERFWRWNAGKEETISWARYLRQIVFSVKVMARQDLRDHDPLSVPISLFSPHYQFWKSWRRRFTN